MSVTMAEFQANVEQYVNMAATQDIFIIQNGQVIAKLTTPYQNRESIAESLFGILPQTTTYEEAMEERGF